MRKLLLHARNNQQVPDWTMKARCITMKNMVGTRTDERNDPLVAVLAQELERPVEVRRSPDETMAD